MFRKLQIGRLFFRVIMFGVKFILSAYLVIVGILFCCTLIFAPVGIRLFQYGIDGIRNDNAARQIEMGTMLAIKSVFS